MGLRFAVVLSALCSVFAVSAASATIINDVELYNGGETVTFGTAADGSNPYGVSGEAGLAGQIELTTSTGATINAWCMDLFHDVYLGSGQSLTYTGTSINGASNGNGGTISNYLASEIAGLVNYGNNLLAAGGSIDQSAGIQMAIWNLEYAGLSYTGPSAAVSYWKQYMLLAPTLASAIDVEAMVSLTGTQQLVAYDSQIPEPWSIAGLVVGVAALFGLRRDRAGNLRQPVLG